jgi:hypothetical protein
MSLRADVIDFLKNEMYVDIEDLKQTIFAPSIRDYSTDLCTYISELYDALSHHKAEDEILRIFSKFKYLHDKEEVYSILDTLRYSFDGIAYGGLHQLYTRQENQGWHLKVKLSCELKPNDIDTLDETLTIYRGCDSNEYKLNTYGQAWSTSQRIAKDFAYRHYEGQPWFSESIRVVLQATIDKKNILYSKQSGEFEIAVNSTCLNNVAICT